LDGAGGLNRGVRRADGRPIKERQEKVRFAKFATGLRPRTGFTRGYIPAPCWGEEGTDVGGLATGTRFG